MLPTTCVPLYFHSLPHYILEGAGSHSHWDCWAQGYRRKSSPAEQAGPCHPQGSLQNSQLRAVVPNPAPLLTEHLVVSCSSPLPPHPHPHSRLSQLKLHLSPRGTNKEPGGLPSLSLNCSCLGPGGAWRGRRGVCDTAVRKQLSLQEARP